MSGKRASLLAMFIALSVVGALIKIPSVIGSVALDAFPALVAAVLLGSRSGAVIAGFGHLLSALIVGFPLGPMHLLIAAEMAVLVWLFGALYEKSKRKIAVGLFLVGNGVIAPLPFLFMLGTGFYMAIMPGLVVASAINLVLAMALIPRLATIFEKKGLASL
ncbi:ECF transporter S component [Alkalihalobacillus hwajinpoensis]|uniref:ECF transporter S component n=1 Tax=Guptibacillus hwajinpoensis TaxID=208199 RepID=UPI0018846219|nr:ECF transporter S component [Pseudalkalibacillus hwajinpoensis]MBF0705343.1 ECF transporter S component [Pseudalkalibacillus hwajinpoensis]